jgi:hypothetical protein
MLMLVEWRKIVGLETFLDPMRLNNAGIRIYSWCSTIWR